MEIPKELKLKRQKITLCMDAMFVNGLCFLTTIDTTIRYRCACKIPRRIMEEYYTAIDGVVRQYNQANIIIEEIRCDPEFTPK